MPMPPLFLCSACRQLVFHLRNLGYHGLVQKRCTARSQILLGEHREWCDAIFAPHVKTLRGPLVRLLATSVMSFTVSHAIGPKAFTKL